MAHVQQTRARCCGNQYERNMACEDKRRRSLYARSVRTRQRRGTTSTARLEGWDGVTLLFCQRRLTGLRCCHNTPRVTARRCMLTLKQAVTRDVLAATRRRATRWATASQQRISVSRQGWRQAARRRGREGRRARANNTRRYKQAASYANAQECQKVLNNIGRR